MNALEWGKALKLVALGDSLTCGWMVKKRYYDRLSEVSKAEKLPLAQVHAYWERKLTEGYDFLNLV